jgi:hypothetical protein
MKRLGVVLLAALIVIVAPVLASAQEATLTGTVTDTTAGALPGVTVRAVHEASGNSFEAVTDERGDYRLALRVGAYQITAELPGFTPVTRSLTLLVGQQAVANLQMAVSGVQESVTVTGEAPLLDVTQSSLGGNIETRQIEELPVQGRNWLDLVLLAPGARGNAMEADSPSAFGSGRTRVPGDFQLNIDGQQLTQLLTGAGDGQPRFSQDSIAEFELLSSRFDATQGRSLGLQVNAITKSGTNSLAGTFSGYFRHDRFNAADHVAETVLPYQNQQLSGTIGGPIRQDRVHFFGNYEYEREPFTAFFTTPYAHFNGAVPRLRLQKKAGARLDAQFSPQTRLWVRGGGWTQEDPRSGGSSLPPSAARQLNKKSDQVLGTLTQVISNRALNEIKGGWAAMSWKDIAFIRNPNDHLGFGLNAPTISLRDVTAGGLSLYPQEQYQDVYSIRDDFTYSLTAKGRHAMKMGAEYLRTEARDVRCTDCAGLLIATGGAVPAPMEQIFPDLYDAGTWNLSLLSPIAVSWTQQFGPYDVKVPRDTFGFWIQDDWTVSPRLTLNLGLRYDLELNAFTNDVAIPPILPGNRPDDKNNIGPRVGFAYSIDDATVLRGGGGIYYGTVVSAYATHHTNNTAYLTVQNDGRPDFASNPWNGPPPTFEQARARSCRTANVPGCVTPEFPTGTATMYAPGFTMPYAYQSSIGVQRQLGPTTAVEADYVYGGHRDVPRPVVLNVTYNPATGANYPLRDVSRRTWPEWGFVKLFFNGSRANQHALQTSFTRRFSGRWQASANYTLSILKDAGPRPLVFNTTSGEYETVPFPTAPDLGGEYAISEGDQRHRAVFNGILELPYAFQLSGLYHYGSGMRYATVWNQDLRGLGTNRTQSVEIRLRPDGSIIPRNNLVGDPIHRVDMRVQRRFAFGSRAKFDGIFEMFNVFNRANYGSYEINERSSSYGQPQQNSLTAYAPRMLQLGFRLAF